jgi:23S rRNA-/tRNA-specific pseudouridylate synthase
VAVARGGPPNATTAYHVVRAFPARLSLLSLTPREGRTHQIRVQCVAHGHPVAGDDRYGDFSANRWLAAEAGLRRMFLVAHSLTFRHPATGREITLRSELREEPAAVLERLESLRSTVPRRSRAKRR